MAEFASAIIALSQFSFQTSKLIYDFAQGVRHQDQRLEDLASKMRSLSLTLKDVEIVARRLKSFHDPEGNLKISSTRIETAVKECESTLKLVTKYSGKLEATLEQSMFKKVLHEWRDDFSGKAALDKALKDIDDRKEDIQSAINIANFNLTGDMHKSFSQGNRPIISCDNTDDSWSLASPGSETSQESIESYTSKQSYADSVFSNTETLMEEERVPSETVLSPLFSLAIENKSKSDVRQQLEEGAQILAQNREGCCALHLAIKAGDKDVLRELLHSKQIKGKPEHLDAVDKTGATALHYAASEGKVKLAIKLLEAGANINALNKHHRSVLFMALKANEDKFVEMLIERGAKEDPNLSAALVKRLKQMQATVNLRQRRKEKEAKKMQGG